MAVPKRRNDEAEEPRLQDTVRLSAEGLAKVLGDLEARVMASIWALGHPAPAKEVHAQVVREHKVALLTVVTVLNKLVEKGLLHREKQSGLLHYQATWSEADFRSHVSRRVVEGILSFGPSAVAASFVDVLADRDPHQLAELRRLIDERLRGEGA
jgi:predicted transcriptional regulator